jgi:hypothetical protein
VDDRLQRVDAGGATLVWGDPARAKAELRDESLQRHLALPLGARLKAALALVRSPPRAAADAPHAPDDDGRGR